jgi:hypothetical protein
MKKIKNKTQEKDYNEEEEELEEIKIEKEKIEEIANRQLLKENNL